jgi:hypothetical protein
MGTAKPRAAGKKLVWPKTFSVQAALVGIGSAAWIEVVAKCFARAKRERIPRGKNSPGRSAA